MGRKARLTDGGELELLDGGGRKWRLFDQGGGSFHLQVEGVVEARLERVTQGDDLTLASGKITISRSYHRVDTEAAAPSGELHTIEGGGLGDRLILRAVNGSRTVVLKDSTVEGNLFLAGDFSLDNTADTIELLQVENGQWVELSRSDNGA